jgi:DDE family transposase
MEGRNTSVRFWDERAGTVRAGRKDLLSQEATPLAPGRIRRSGGGREKIVVKITNIDEVFETILQEHTAGSPMDEKIKWTDMTQKEIMEAFHGKGYAAVTKHVVRQLLKKHGYVKRKMRKSKTVKETAHRDEQFQQIHK